MKHLAGLAVLVALSATFAFADYSGLPDGVKSNLSAIKRYPKAASILLWVKDVYVMSENGQQTYEHHEYRYLPDEAARDAWGDPRIAFVDGRQTVDVLTARSYTKDGRTIDIEPNALNPVTPDELDHAPDFSNFKQLVVTLLGLENGCIAELNYRLTTEKPLYPWMWGRVYFREEVPVIARELSVQLPGGSKLSYKADHGLSAPLITGSTYVWREDEQPGYVQADLGGHRVLLPNVAFTTASDWAEVIGELRQRISTSSDNPELPATLAEKLGQPLGQEDRLDTIKTWVRERFNEIDFDHPDFMISVRPASEVLQSGYGNSVEMAVLVSQLCTRAGLTATPEAWFAFDPPVPYLYDLTGGLVKTVTEDGTIESDPLAPGQEFSRADLADATILSLTADSNSPRRFSSGENNGQLQLNLTIDSLDADTLHGNGTLIASGLQTPYETLRADPKAELEHLMGWRDVSIGKATVKHLAPMAATVEFSFTLPALDTVDGQHVLPADPVDLTLFASSPVFDLERREFPHWVRLPGLFSVHVDAPLADGWTATQLPDNVTRQWQNGSGMRTVEVRNGRVKLNETLTLGDEWIQPQDWSMFRSFLLETGHRHNNIIVFAKKPN